MVKYIIHILLCKLDFIIHNKFKAVIISALHWWRFVKSINAMKICEFFVEVFYTGIKLIG